MGQLAEFIFEYQAFAEGSDGDVVPFGFRISEPDFDDARGFFCVINCEYIRARPFLIFGIDEAQAKFESYKFIRTLILHKSKRLLDDQSNEIELPEKPPFIY